jgi:hypothetical protein
MSHSSSFLPLGYALPCFKKLRFTIISNLCGNSLIVYFSNQLYFFTVLLRNFVDAVKFNRCYLVVFGPQGIFPLLNDTSTVLLPEKSLHAGYMIVLKLFYVDRIAFKSDFIKAILPYRFRYHILNSLGKLFVFSVVCNPT